MGAGSSKSPTQNSTPKPEPVANVNNSDTGFPQRNVDKEIKDDNKPDDEEINTVQNLNNKDYHKDFGKQSPLKPIESNKKEKDKKDKDKNKEKELRKKQERSKNDSAISGHEKQSYNLQFEDDSDFNEDIDEVLRIPLAADISKDKNKKDKDKKSRKDKMLNNENENTAVDYNSNNFVVSRNEDQPLPETYAQRLQRKQYKLQQEMLIREKTVMRLSYDWNIENNSNENEMEIVSCVDLLSNLFIVYYFLCVCLLNCCLVL